MTNDPIVIVLEGGLVQGVYCPEGQPLTRPVVVIDYDTEGMDDDNGNVVPIPQNAEGDTSHAWVSVHGQAGWLNPVIAEFIAEHVI